MFLVCAVAAAVVEVAVVIEDIDVVPVSVLRTCLLPRRGTGSCEDDTATAAYSPPPPPPLPPLRPCEAWAVEGTRRRLAACVAEEAWRVYVPTRTSAASAGRTPNTKTAATVGYDACTHAATQSMGGRVSVGFQI